MAGMLSRRRHSVGRSQSALLRWEIQQVVERCSVQHDTGPALDLMLLVEVAVLDTRSHSGLGPAGDAEHRDARPRIHAEDLQAHPARPRGKGLRALCPRDRHANFGEICPLTGGSRLVLGVGRGRSVRTPTKRFLCIPHARNRCARCFRRSDGDTAPQAADHQRAT
jgi:hypothetical protein